MNFNLNQSTEGPQGKQQPPRPTWTNLLTWLILIAFFVFAWFLPSLLGKVGTQGNETVSYSTFIGQVNANNVQSVTISDYTVTGVFKSPVLSADGTMKSTQFTTTVPQFGNNILIALLQEHHVAITAQPPGSGFPDFLSNLLIFVGPILLMILLFWWLSRRMTRAQSGLFSFGKSRARLYMGGKTQTTFADVAGVDEAKAELAEIVEFLKAPTRFQRLGGKIPRGILLVGPPGAGKTLLAKAVAGEADVPFFSMSASEFVEMFVGVGASRVRDLFETARKNAPCIIFIDELDAVGRQRGAGLGGGNDEREQTLNQVLVEMDGFDPHEAIIVLAATNRPDVLDPALLRPGRFDRQIVVDRPDRAGREAILRVHARLVPLAPDVKLDVIAAATVGMVGTGLANLVNEAALLAARGGKKVIGQEELEEGIMRVLAGPEKKARLLSEQERKITAYHEMGHALVGHFLENTNPVHKITIVSRGQALGLTISLPTEDKYLTTRK